MPSCPRDFFCHFLLTLGTSTEVITEAEEEEAEEEEEGLSNASFRSRLFFSLFSAILFMYETISSTCAMAPIPTTLHAKVLMTGSIICQPSDFNSFNVLSVCDWSLSDSLSD